MKILLQTDQLIEHMVEKGIKFKIETKENAKVFLNDSNYYLKLASYRYNYDKNPSTGKYKNLDFAYLKELSIIDMRLRYIIIEMCLDIEHIIKVKLLKEIENNAEENGYDIIRKYINRYPNVCSKINSHRSSEYCRQLIDKYHPYYPAWVFVEVVSFGEIVKLCSFYTENYGTVIIEPELLNAVRDLRNACAHSNCLINKLRKGTSKSEKPIRLLNDYATHNAGIGQTMRKNKLSNQFMSDFTALMIAYDKLVESKGMRKHTKDKLNKLFKERVKRHEDYFKNNSIISTSFIYLEKIVDSFNVL